MKLYYTLTKWPPRARVNSYLARPVKLEMYVESRWLITVNAVRSCDNSISLHTYFTDTVPIAANGWKHAEEISKHANAWNKKKLSHCSAL